MKLKSSKPSKKIFFLAQDAASGQISKVLVTFSLKELFKKVDKTDSSKARGGGGGGGGSGQSLTAMPSIAVAV